MKQICDEIYDGVAAYMLDAIILGHRNAYNGTRRYIRHRIDHVIARVEVGLHANYNSEET
jgi:hypothetical protein